MEKYNDGSSSGSTMPKKGKSSVLHDGLKDCSASSSDASTTLKGGSVNEGAVRTGTAKTPPTLGPRTA